MADRSAQSSLSANIDSDGRVILAQLPGDFCRTVFGAIVDDQDVSPGNRLAKGLDELSYIFGFIKRANAYQYSRRRWLR